MNDIHTLSKKNKKNNNLIWIIGAVVLILGLGLGIYFFVKSNNSSTDNPNIHYLPNKEEFQEKVNQIKTQKGIDDQQAAIEVLTDCVPYINWWEINSLSELDEKIKLVNSKTQFPPFTAIPDLVKFSSELSENMNHKITSVMASMIPRKVDNTPDWKGHKDLMTYLITVLVPQWESLSYKPTFATSENYYELVTKMTGQVNQSMLSLAQKFANLTTVGELNEMVNDYLEITLKGSFYADIHDRLAKQLSITPHKKYEFQRANSTINNSSLNITFNPSLLKQN